MGEEVLEGVDVAGWQKPKNCDYLAGARSGLRYVIAKASQGERRMSSFAKHVEKVLAANREINARNLALPEDDQIPPILLGAYHFADPLKLGLRTFRPVEQADTFCAALEAAGWPWPHSLIPWLDMEWKAFGKTKAGKARGKAFRRQFHKGQVMEWTRRFNGRVAANLGVMPGVYSGRSYVRYRYGYAPDLRFYEFWRAGYTDVGEGRDRLPSPAECPPPIELEEGFELPTTVWQFTGRGRVDWYRRGKGKIDRNLIIGGEAVLERITYQPEVTQ